MKKIAVILTNNNHYGDSNEPTGLWLAGLLNVRNSDGSYLIAGKRITWLA